MSDEDIFDEDLVRELGLEPEDLQGPGAKKKRSPISASARASVQENSAEAAYQPKPSVPKKSVENENESLKNIVHQAGLSDGEPVADLEYSSEISKNIPVQIAAVIAKKSVKLKDILELAKGEIIEFKKAPQEPLDLVANGKLIAKAELVLVDGKIGARIIKLIK